MKGIIFNEFLDMVEEKFSLEIADHIIENSNLGSKGIYTAVGTYDHGEIVRLVQNLSTAVGVDIPSLLKIFGFHLFGRFHATYPELFVGIKCPIQLLSKVEGVLHMEVKKLYMEASLPTFDYETVEPNKLSFVYASRHPFADLAEGLICGCVDHFDADMDILREDLGAKDGTSARFTVERRAPS